MRCVRCLLAGSTLLCSTAAQHQFEALGREHLSDRGLLRWTGQVALRDLDGDGDLDLITSDVGFGLGWTEISTFANDGAGRFTTRTNRARTRFTVDAKLAVGDLDGDGDADLVYDLWVLTNDGRGSFLATQQLPTAAAVAAELRDFDRDGDLDLLAMDFSASFQLYWNDGTGRLTSPRSALPGAKVVALGDLDGDGDDDAVTAPLFDGGSRDARVWIHDGRGGFAQQASSLFPQVHREVTAIAIGDVDGDGDNDVLLGTTGHDVYAINLGGGAWVNGGHLGSHAAPTGAFALSDFDRDGDLDVLVGHRGEPDRLLLNDGTGLFREAPAALSPVPGGFGDTLGFAVGDVDGDGNADVVVGTRGGDDLLLWGIPGGGFALAGDAGLTGVEGTMIPADFDGDGDLDLFTSAMRERLWRNDGTGRFVPDAQVVPEDGVLSNGAAAGDVDGDGDVDVVVANDARTLLYLNDGTGRFQDATSGRIPPLPAVLSAPLLADFDNDGDLDVYLHQPTSGRVLFVNDGTGRFRDEAALRLPSTGNVLAVRTLVRDLDGDAAVELYFHGTTPSLWLNDGSGRFRDASSQLAPVAATTAWVDAGDVDGDGDVDLVFEDRIASNDGTARFSIAPRGNLPRGLPRGFPTLVDADDDGDLDLVYGGETSDGWRNDGTGVFRAAPLIDARDSGIAIAGDFDGDGDVDLLAAAGLWVNGHRQMRAPSTPRVGQPYRFDLYARPGYGVQPKLAFVVIGWRRLAVDVPPLGRWWIDPNGAVDLPLAFLPPNGTATIALPIPNVAALRGGRFFAQALFVDLDGGSRFGNLIDATVR